MGVIEGLLIIAILIFSSGNMDAPQRHEEHYNPPRYESCYNGYSTLHVERKSPWSNATHVTHIDFTTMSKSQATGRVVDAYYYWGDRVGRDAADWFADRAGEQGVHIYFARGGTRNYPPIDRVEFSYSCWR